MLNSSCFFSIVITLNHIPKYLDKFLDNITNQAKKLGQNEIIIINNIPNQQKSIKINDLFLKYNMKKVNKLVVNDIFLNILDICQGEILIFIDGNFYPDDNWLDQIIKPFDNSNTNIVSGQICQDQNNKLTQIISNFLDKNGIKWNNFYDNQIANMAVRKNYLQQAKNINLSRINPQDINLYYRILREVEAEIVYNPSSIVYQNETAKIIQNFHSI